jgi:AcrR family transcriptional regulator
VLDVDARTAMVDAAEVLFAERSVGAVSLREVGAAAGQRNNSAAQYHFGSRTGLLRAVFERRMGPINEARQAMLDDAGDDPDLRTLIEALVVPLVDAVTGTDTSHYARFLVQVMASDELAGPDDQEAPFTLAFRTVQAGIQEALVPLPPALAQHRTTNAVLLLVNAVATWEHARALGRPAADPGLLRTDLVDSILGLLTAPTTLPVARRAPVPTTTSVELAC